LCASEAAVAAASLSPLSIRITQRIGAEDQMPVMLMGPGPHFVGRKAHRSSGWTPSNQMMNLLWSKGNHMEIGWKDPDRFDTGYAKLLAERTRNATMHKPGVRAMRCVHRCAARAWMYRLSLQLCAV
jgi:hypothetical protein